MTIQATKQIVKVKYYDELIKDYIGREYSYYSEDHLEPGDVVIVPVKDTTGQALVVATNLPEFTIAKFKDLVKTIPAGSLVDDITVKAEEAEGGIEDLFGEPVTSILVTSGDTALIAIKPEASEAVIALTREIDQLRRYAIGRVILSDDDLIPATNDLALIANLKKSLKAEHDKYAKPIKGHLDDINSFFKRFTDLLKEADDTNREKVDAYREDQRRRAAEAEEINRKKLELARQEAAFNGTGEISVDLTPVEAPAPVQKISTMSGTFSTAKVWKWDLVDMSQVPEEYKIIDAAKTTKVVKAGLRNIPGIRIYQDECSRVTTR